MKCEVSNGMSGKLSGVSQEQGASKREVGVAPCQRNRPVNKNLLFDIAREWRAQLAYLFVDSWHYAIPRIDYEEYWKARGPREVPARASVIAEFVRDGETLLDVGCGDGDVLAAVVASTGIKAKGIDISGEALSRAERAGLLVERADITSSSFMLNDVYDYILISEVLEHVVCPEQVLQKVKAHFRKGLIVTIPNVAFYLHRIRLLLGRFPVQWKWHPSEHLRYWGVRDFREFAKGQGFRIEAMRSSNGFPFMDGRFPQWHRLWPSLLGEVIVFRLVGDTAK